MKSKTSTILLVIVIVLVVLLVALAGWKLFFAAPAYHAVYLTTGDLYFGTLVQFPAFGLKQVYTIQVNPQNEETPLSIQRFRNVFWGPDDFLRLNRDQVVWRTKLVSTGQLAQLISQNPDLIPTQQGSAPLPPVDSE